MDNHAEIMQAIGELNGLFTGIDKKVDKTVEGIEKQNGRVRKLEGYQTGFVMVGSLFIILVVPLIVYIYTTQIKELKTEIRQLQAQTK